MPSACLPLRRVMLCTPITRAANSYKRVRIVVLCCKTRTTSYVASTALAPRSAELHALRDSNESLVHQFQYSTVRSAQNLAPWAEKLHGKATDRASLPPLGPTVPASSSPIIHFLYTLSTDPICRLCSPMRIYIANQYLRAQMGSVQKLSPSCIEHSWLLGTANERDASATYARGVYI